jgi:hypothetical protein
LKLFTYMLTISFSFLEDSSYYGFEFRAKKSLVANFSFIW